MKVEFRYQNGTSTLILTPEDAREKTQIQLFNEGKLRTGASTAGAPESLVMVTEIDRSAPSAQKEQQ